ncbi:hypothetical protein KEM52_003310 [Ascosphaera acerosa]|nr:hypothetical protein KEM52_003310 [Ascosphaera acerosa]
MTKTLAGVTGDGGVDGGVHSSHSGDVAATSASGGTMCSRPQTSRSAGSPPGPCLDSSADTDADADADSDGCCSAAPTRPPNTAASTRPGNCSRLPRRSAAPMPRHASVPCSPAQYMSS